MIFLALLKLLTEPKVTYTPINTSAYNSICVKDVKRRDKNIFQFRFLYRLWCTEKQFRWVYISDRKQQMLLTAPYHVTNLVHHEEIQLKFTAPFKPGFYTFAVCLRSDSYLGFDQMKEIKVCIFLLLFFPYHFFILSLICIVLIRFFYFSLIQWLFRFFWSI